MGAWRVTGGAGDRTFSPDGNSQTGAWVYPGGGGYQATATRIEG